MAHELLNEYYDPKDLNKADIFSLGATMYELIIGEDLPCNGEEWHLIRQGKLEKLEKNVGVSEKLKLLVRNLMANNPENRPSADDLLEHEVFFEEERGSWRFKTPKSNM